MMLFFSLQFNLGSIDHFVFHIALNIHNFKKINIVTLRSLAWSFCMFIYFQLKCLKLV